MPSRKPQIVIRVSQAQKDAWEEAATSVGRSLSSYIRTVMDASAATAELPVGLYNPETSSTTRPEPKVVSTVDVDAEDRSVKGRTLKPKSSVRLPGISSAEAAVAATRLAGGKCMAHAPAGTKCKFCGKVH